MDIHNRIVTGPVAGSRADRTSNPLRVMLCAALLGLLAACVAQSPTLPDPAPAPPVPEMPPENEDGWNAITG